MKTLLCALLLFGHCAAQAASPWPRQVAPGVFQVGQLDTNQINESSGLLPSHRSPGAFWTHNDGDNTLFGINRRGQRLGHWKFGGPLLHDFEDIAWTPGRIYLADIGNNLFNRTNVFVYAVPEPGPTFSGTLPLKGVWRLSYAGSPFDSESFLVFRQHGYLIEKDRIGGSVGLHRFSLLRPRSVLEPQCRLNVADRVGGADLTQDGRRLALITDLGPQLFELPGTVPALGTLFPAVFVPFSFPAMEGCCFTRDGLLVTAESGEMFLFTHERFRLGAVR